MTEPEQPEVVITTSRSNSDPSISIYQVDVHYQGAQWSEAWGSKEQLVVYLRGLEAGFAMNKVFITTPEIPR